MSKRSFFLFALFFAFFAVAIPLWATSKEGDPSNSPEKVAEADEHAKLLFSANCGSCHTLARAGTDGIVGPNLDDLLGGFPPESNIGTVENAIANGAGEGRMPAGILQGTNTDTVADFVSRVAGQ